MTDRITRILVPVDFSPPARRALRYATMLAQRAGARLTLLYVVEDVIVPGAWGPEVYVPDITELLRTLVATANRRLATMTAQTEARGVAASKSVITGRAAPAIVDYAANGRFNLIVMGTHGRTGLSHAIMGSVAERVVRQAHCPVLTVRGDRPGTSRSRRTPAPAPRRKKRSIRRSGTA